VPRARDVFTTIRSEGALLPPDFLKRVAEGDKDITGLAPESYHLPPREKLSEAITRSWNRLLGFWSAFQGASASLNEGDAASGLTRDKWLLPLFQELGYGRLPAGSGYEIDGKRYPISHSWQNTPIHLLGRNVDLDRPTKGVAGAARHSPHGLVQEFLNRHEGHLWGFLANGLKLRVLRDNKSLTRQAYVEFDLAGMMDGQVYSDFALLWLLCHQSRVETEQAEPCWLEKWTEEARERGTRALDTLRRGVKEAIEALGKGFLAHAANKELIERLRKGTLDKQNYYRQLLRTVYRLIFLFVAEDRDLLLTAPHGSKERERYVRHYSTQRLRTLAERRRGSPHPDLWEGLRLVFSQLSSANGCRQLGLPALGSFLWSDKATPELDRCELANMSLLQAVRELAFTQDGNVRRTIDYRNLGAEELGSVYESLLELHPDLNSEVPTFELKIAAGHERKTTGSYYTPSSLIECLLDSALDPVLQEAAKQPDPEKAILDLKVCDPACGSGHFLIAAAHRLANRLAAIRTGDEEPSPGAVRKALRDIVGRCLYGADINPMAVELCKVNLWLEALEPGKPLSFLEHHIQCGNSLLGATPALLEKGIPDEAFEPLEGDDKTICRIFKKKNKAERESGQTSLLERMHEPTNLVGDLATALAELDAIPGDTPEGQRAKQTRWEELVGSESYESSRLVADAWCAAFVWKKVEDPNLPYPIGESTFRQIEKKPALVPDWMSREIRRLSDEYGFFHWHQAFPRVFRVEDVPDSKGPGWSGGFDVVLGNPPWDELTPVAKDFFSAYDPSIRFQDRAGEERIVERLMENPGIAREWQVTCRRLYGQIHFIREAGRYTLFAPGNLGKGDFNVYRMFVETGMAVLRPGGMLAQLVPEALYNGSTAMAIRGALLDQFEWRRLVGFENAGEVWFDGIDTRMKFCLYTARKGGKTEVIDVGFGVRSTRDLQDALGSGALRLPAALIERFSPDALAIMELSSQRDVDIADRMYSAWPTLGDGSAGPPHRHHMRELDMTVDRHRFTEDSAGLPVYEGRMVDAFDHRAKGYRSGRARAAVWVDLRFDDPAKGIQPQWYVPESALPEKLGDRPKRYRVGFCNITSPTNERTLVAALIPPGCVCGNTVPTITFEAGWEWAYMVWLAVANSFVMDFLARKKVSLHVTNTVLDSLPFPRLSRDDARTPRIVELAARLTCTSPEMRGYWDALARDGWVPPAVESIPGIMDEGARREVQAELDALVVRDVFAITRNELAHILETFPIVRRREREQFGDFVTARAIFQFYDNAGRAVTSVLPLSPHRSGSTLASVSPPSRAEGEPKGKVAELVAKIRSIEERGRMGARVQVILPTYNLRAAAGSFDDIQAVGTSTSRAFRATRSYSKRPGEFFFAAEIDGRSMEPTIPDGSWCVFRRPATLRDGGWFLVERHKADDPDRGGRYVVKEYSRRAGRPQLFSTNLDYSPIDVSDADRIIAEWMEVVQPC
jgi:phage repressor protein C with HTH and peptisase S24 domain